MKNGIIGKKFTMTLHILRESFAKDIFIGHKTETLNKLVLIQEIPGMEKMKAIMEKPENTESIAKPRVK